MKILLNKAVMNMCREDKHYYINQFFKVEAVVIPEGYLPNREQRKLKRNGNWFDSYTQAVRRASLFRKVLEEFFERIEE